MERPKRRITSRCLDYNGGMLHEEELALRRALQASLTASKTLILEQKSKKNTNTGSTTTEDSVNKSDKAWNGSKKGSDKGNPKMTEKTFDKRLNIKRKCVGAGRELEKPKRRRKLLVRDEPKVLRKATGKVLKLECKQRSDVAKHKRKAKDKPVKKGLRKKKKKVDGVKMDDQIKKGNESAAHVVHAQRKFAHSNPSSPRSLLLCQMQPLKTRAKTEDFLDFLCLRGTDRLPKALELFNSPCAPLSPLTDDEEPSKISPSKISTNGPSRSPPGSSDGESSAKRSLNLTNECATKSSSSSTSNSSVSSPVSTRVQPHAVLPHFTNANYGILANIPTPIPYPRASSTFLTPPTPPRSQGLDAYGAPITGPRLLPSSICHPRVSSVATGMHRPSSCSRRGEGFYPVGQRLPFASDGGAGVTGDKSPVVSIVNSGTGTTLSKKVVDSGTITTLSKKVVDSGTVTTLSKKVVDSGTITTLSKKVVDSGTGTTLSKKLVDSGAVTTLSKKVVDSGAGTTLSKKVVNSGTGTTLSKKVVDSGAVTTLSKKVVDSGTGTTLSKKVVDSGTGTTLSKKVVDSGTITTLSKKVVDSGTGTTLSKKVVDSGTGTTLSKKVVDSGTGTTLSKKVVDCGTGTTLSKKVVDSGTGTILSKKVVDSGAVTTLSKKVGRSPNKSPKGPHKSPKKGSVKTAIKKDSKGTSINPEKNTLLGVAVNDNRVLDGQGLDEVPLFTPTEQEFKHPLRYIESIAARAEPYGICVVLPPESWKPDFCLSDNIRFTTKFQYIHRLGNRHPAVELQLAAVRKHLEKQKISLATMPQIAGCEVDLPYMSKVVQELGGLQEIIDKRKWGKVADTLRIPKTYSVQAVDRSSKLEQIYCKFLLSFDLLSEEERNKLFESVQKEQNTIEESPTNTSREYMAKGRSMSLSVFQRTAKNVMDHHVKANANVKDVEKTFWRVQGEGQRYVVVHTAEFPHTAFPTEKGNPCSKCKWNLNVLPKTSSSAVRDLTEVEGISSPLVKLEMAMSTSVWQTSPHGLYTIEYLHQGSDKIWYCVPSDSKDKFSEVVSAEFNGKVDVKDHMMSPLSLMNAGVPVYKTVQKPRQFIIKFPGAYHSSLSSGYAVSEAVFVAPWSHIQRGIKTSFQPVAAHQKVDQLFSWERLIVSSLREELRRNSSENILNILIPELEQIMSHEAAFRSEILKYGVDKKPESDDLQDVESSGKSLPFHFDQDEIINCAECNQYCFLSSTLNESNQFLCLQHAVNKLRELKKNDNNMTLVVRLHMSKLDELLKEAKEKLQELQQKPKPLKRRLTTPS